METERCGYCGLRWEIRNARCGSELHAQRARDYQDANACDHCGAPPERADPYWTVDDPDTADYHPNHCPHCGAYHAPMKGGASD